MKIHDVEQGSREWLDLRLGIPTASELDSIITPLWKERTGEGVRSYLYRKLCEKALGYPLDDASSFAMEQGKILEHEAIPWYEFAHDVKVQRVGFCTTDDGRVGCSPDGLIGEHGGVEIKCPQPQTHLKYLFEQKLPTEYAAQVHGSMFVTGRPWWMFTSYCRKFPPFVLKVERDEKIQDALRSAINAFLADFDKQVNQLRKHMI